MSGVRKTEFASPSAVIAYAKYLRDRGVGKDLVTRVANRFRISGHAVRRILAKHPL